MSSISGIPYEVPNFENGVADEDFRDVQFQVLAVIEIEYLNCLNSILNKPKWWEKMKDPEILSKWMHELESWCNNQIHPQLVDNEQVVDHGHHLYFADCCEHLKAELAALADMIQSKPGFPIISPTSAHGVFIADDLIPPEVDDIIKQYSTLLTDEVQDMRLSGNAQVLDLIHPSMYSLRYGETLWASNPHAAFGERVIPIPNHSYSEVSAKYQWLPAEFHVNEVGRVKIKSYINNLSTRSFWPKYGAIRDVFQQILPMLEMTIESMDKSPAVRVCVDQSRLQEDKYEYQEMKWEAYRIEHGLEEEDRDEFDDNYEDFRPVDFPPFPSEYSNDTLITHYPASKHIRDQNLQVIVKMSTIDLTPDNPVFKGGSWHLEGMLNEAIAATAIYYYDVENITESRLLFRHVYDAERFDYGQDDYYGLEAVYGFSNHVSDNLQPSGSIIAMKGRCVTFPNFHHHRVESFELADKTKNGYRKILCFFVVKPDVRIPSTLHVPPQQSEEVYHRLRRCLPAALSDDTVLLIMSFMKGTLSKERAVHHAHQLSEERKISDRHGYPGVSQIFLCEH